jgi:hypothetical protein
MPIKVSSEQRTIEDLNASLVKAPAKPLKPVDLTTNEIAIARLKGSIDFVLAGQHNLFNPVKWQRKPDGGWIKASEAGLNFLEITKITPLTASVTLDEIAGEGNTVRFTLTVQNEANRQARAVRRVLTLQSTNSPPLTLKSVQTNAAGEVSLQVFLDKDKTPITITTNKPFSQMVAYAADLKSDTYNFNRKNLRVKDQFTLGEETYNIVAISRDEVVLSAHSNAKQTTLKYNAAVK